MWTYQTWRVIHYSCQFSIFILVAVEYFWLQPYFPWGCHSRWIHIFALAQTLHRWLGLCLLPVSHHGSIVSWRFQFNSSYYLIIKFWRPHCKPQDPHYGLKICHSARIPKLWAGAPWWTIKVLQAGNSQVIYLHKHIYLYKNLIKGG